MTGNYEDSNNLARSRQAALLRVVDAQKAYWLTDAEVERQAGKTGKHARIPWIQEARRAFRSA